MTKKSYKLVTIRESFWTDMDEKDIEKKYSNYQYGIDGKITKFDEMCEYFYETGYCDEDFIHKYKSGHSASLEEAKKKVQHICGVNVSKTTEQTNCLIEEIERLKKNSPTRNRKISRSRWRGFLGCFCRKNDGRTRRSTRRIKAHPKGESLR